MRTFVIAEAGGTHDLDMGKALRLISAAKQSGADAYKLQYWCDSKRLAERRNAPELADLYERCRIPTWWVAELSEVARATGLAFMCTTYLPEDIHVVAPWVDRFKIASFESQDLHFVRAHQSFEKETIVSTGLCDEEAFWRLQDVTSVSRSWNLRFLHCVSAYPAPISALNLRAIGRYVLDGFSDHTTSLITGGLAVAAGAHILEKHLRLDDTDPANPDYDHSLPPMAFAEYVQNTRLAEAAMGDGRKTVAEAEAPWARYVVRP